MRVWYTNNCIYISKTIQCRRVWYTKINVFITQNIYNLDLHVYKSKNKTSYSYNLTTLRVHNAPNKKNISQTLTKRPTIRNPCHLLCFITILAIWIAQTVEPRIIQARHGGGWRAGKVDFHGFIGNLWKINSMWQTWELELQTKKIPQQKTGVCFTCWLSGWPWFLKYPNLYVPTRTWTLSWTLSLTLRTVERMRFNSWNVIIIGAMTSWDMKRLFPTLTFGESCCYMGAYQFTSIVLYILIMSLHLPSLQLAPIADLSPSTCWSKKLTTQSQHDEFKIVLPGVHCLVCI